MEVGRLCVGERETQRRQEEKRGSMLVYSYSILAQLPSIPAGAAAVALAFTFGCYFSYYLLLVLLCELA